MKLSEKIGAKLGIAFGMMINPNASNLTPEQKRQFKQQVYREMEEDDRRQKAAAAAAARASAGSYRVRECCANCFYFNDFMGQYCTKHQYAFTTSEEVNGAKYNTRCSEYRKDT